jgi:hypothetical protein
MDGRVLAYSTLVAAVAGCRFRQGHRTFRRNLAIGWTIVFQRHCLGCGLQSHKVVAGVDDMIDHVEELEALYTTVYRHGYRDRPSDYHNLHMKLTAALKAGVNREGDEWEDNKRKIVSWLTSIEIRMKPKLSFPGGSASC